MIALGAPGSVARYLTSPESADLRAMARDNLLGGRWAVFEYVNGRDPVCRAMQPNEALARAYVTTDAHVLVDMDQYRPN